jgi:hypothetical protein
MARCTRYNIMWLATGRWVSPGTPVSSTNNTDRHDMAKVLLTVASNTTSHHKTELILKYWHHNLSVVTWQCMFYVLQFDLIHTSLNKFSFGICCIYCWRIRFDWDEERNFMRREKISIFPLWTAFMCSNAPAAHAYEVYILQVIRYSRACGFYQDFRNRGLLLTSFWNYGSYWLSGIRVITKLPNSEQSYKGKVKTHKFINRQNQSTTGKLWKP